MTTQILRTTTELPVLPPKSDEQSETDWSLEWTSMMQTAHLQMMVVRRRQREMHNMGQMVSDQINSDPEESARLLRSRASAKAGNRTPLRDVMKSS